MISVDDVLKDPSGVIGLPEGAVPMHAIVIVSYMTPGSERSPHLERIGMASDDALSSHASIGMLRYALQRDLNAVAIERSLHIGKPGGKPLNGLTLVGERHIVGRQRGHGRLVLSVIRVEPLSRRREHSVGR